MKRALVLFGALLTQLTPPAFGRMPAHSAEANRMPALNVEAICKARSAAAKVLRSTPDQSIPDCIKGEEAAKKQLSDLWASISPPIRNQCKSEARSLGTTSYLDLLTCMQMAQEMKSDAQKKKTNKQ
jgi:hypothetical protein